ncbi:hypothetical protein V1264_005548 [Littorina saxatilis]|uniref:Uncharacterized protein n=1 Tax=Littorina saxatilis TaxID=31220 RepID=A0AAN9G729_9CAEN
MHARCLFLCFLLISIAGRSLIYSDDRVYHASRRLNALEKLNRRNRDSGHTLSKRQSTYEEFADEWGTIEWSGW